MLGASINNTIKFYEFLYNWVRIDVLKATLFLVMLLDISSMLRALSELLNIKFKSPDINVIFTLLRRKSWNILHSNPEHEILSR